jgi:hypothetical protein
MPRHLDSHRVIRSKEGRICGGAANGFDDAAGRRQLQDLTLTTSSLSDVLPRKSALIRRIEQRHPIFAPDPRVEFMDLARHLYRREPVDKSGRVQEGRVELLEPGPDDPRCADGGAYILFGHVTTLLGPSQKSAVTSG